jgi:signal transduction histidine kinase
MRSFALETRITLWSVAVVTAAIVVCGTVALLYVLHSERNELDDDLTHEAGRFLEQWQRAGGERFDWAKGAGQVPDWVAPTAPARILEVVDGTGRVLYRSSSWPAQIPVPNWKGFGSASVGDVAWRIGVFPANGLTLHLGGDMAEVTDLAEHLAVTLLITLPFVLVLVVFGGRLIARKALAPIKQITEVAEHITARDLGQRISLPPARDEIHRLGTVLNATLDRLEQSFHQASRFSADASHELKTPLAVLRSSIESMLAASTGHPETQEGLTGLLEETRRLSAIIESLLLLARADAGKLQLDLQPGDLVEVIRLCADDAVIFFEREHLQMELELPSAAPARFDGARLSQILLNLFENARKYNREHGRVKIRLCARAGNWEIRIANTGPGIRTEDVPRLFTRFFRGEHSSEKSGQGLGLSLSRELARAHGGDLVLTPDEPDWTTFLLTLPQLEGGRKS